MNHTMRHPLNSPAAGFAGAQAPATMTGLVDRVRKYFATRRALAEVRSLDERMLRDIGLEAHQIDSAVRGRD